MKRSSAAAGVLLAVLALAGCGRRDDTAGERAGADSTVAQAPSPATDVAARVSRDAAEAARQAALEAKEASKNAADQATNKVADALITTSVHAELARDPILATLRIDVDTDSGRVALRGTAPDQAAKDRAGELAAAVQGVVSVDNELSIEAQQG